MKKLLLFLIACCGGAALLTEAGCSRQKTFSHVTYEGMAYDPAGNPLEGCTVFLSACVPNDGRNECTTFDVGKAGTDASGHFRIHEKAARSGRYFIYASSGKYESINIDAVSQAALSSAKCTSLHFK